MKQEEELVRSDRKWPLGDGTVGRWNPSQQCLGTNSIRRLILEIRSRNDREKKNERIVEETKQASELGQAKAKLGQGPSSPNSAKGRVPQFGQGPRSPARPRFDHFLLDCFTIVYLL